MITPGFPVSIRDQVVEPQVLLIGEQHVVHRPELALSRRGLGGELGVRVRSGSSSGSVSQPAESGS
jgi:hypothetical protein